MVVTAFARFFFCASCQGSIQYVLEHSKQRYTLHSALDRSNPPPLPLAPLDSPESDSYYIVSPRSLQSNTYYCSTYLSTEGRASDYLLNKSKKKNCQIACFIFVLCSAHDLQKWPTNFLSNRRSF